MTNREENITPSEPPHHGMKKDFYNQHSTTQSSAISLCTQLLVKAAQEVPLQDHISSHPLQVAEWGCAHGANSIAPVCLIADVLTQRLAGQGTQQPLQIHITHVDVPNNDWSALFSCTQQYTRKIHQACPGIEVTAAAVGRTMYEWNLPSRSIALGFSFSALHWQSKKACILQRTINPGCSKTQPEEHALLKAHAVSDLQQFLQIRAAEFITGGLLVLLYVGYNEQVPLESAHFHDAAQAVAEALVSEGLLQEHELGLMSAPVYFLDEQTQRQVYASVADAWELLHLDVMDNVSSSWRDYQDGRASKEEQAAAFANFARAVLEPSMAAGLKESGRQEQEISQLLEVFFERMTAAAVADPQPASYPATRVLLRRR